MKKFIGLLSVEDAEVLEKYARDADRILEFGSGGSTHIFAQAAPQGATIVSVDTDADWIARTRRILEKLHVSERVTFHEYAAWGALRASISPFSIIFVDGLWGERLSFAINSWSLLEVGGTMLLHDTRRPKDIANVLALLRHVYLSVECVHANERIQGRTSNLTAIRKKEHENEVDWYVTEKKPQWMYGLEPNIPDDFWSR